MGVVGAIAQQPRVASAMSNRWDLLVGAKQEALRG